MLLEEQEIFPQERLELPSGITPAYGQRIWVALAAANILPLRLSMTRGKSLALRTLLAPSFHLCGRRRAAFGGFRCCLATTAERRSASIVTAMWLDTLRAQMEGKLFSGREVRTCTISAFCPEVITAVP